MSLKRTVLVGAPPSPPYQYFDGDGNAAGIDFETLRNVFAGAGYTVEIILRDWPEIKRMMNAGELDAMFPVRKTPEREKIWLFSDLLRKAAIEVISSRPDLWLERLAQATDKDYRIGLLQGYSYGEEADSLPQASRQEYASPEELLTAVSRYEIQLALFDRGLCEYLSRKLAVDNIHRVPRLGFTVPLYVAFRDNALREAFNKELAGE